MSRMRTRLIEPGFFQNEDLAALPPFGRLLFAGLWCLADREGRLDDRPPKIRALLFAYEEVPVDELLGGLAKAGLVTRYEVGGRKYLQVNKFLEHQKPHPREEKSIIPSPGLAKVSPGPTLDTPRRVVLVSVSNSVSTTSASSPADSTPEPELFKLDTPPIPEPVLVFPAKGEPKQWHLTPAKLAEWQGTFPDLDVLSTCRKALQWLRDNPEHGKTAKGMMKYIGGFLGREQNDPRSALRRNTSRSKGNGNGKAHELTAEEQARWYKLIERGRVGLADGHVQGWRDWLDELETVPQSAGPDALSAKLDELFARKHAAEAAHGSEVAHG